MRLGRLCLAVVIVAAILAASAGASPKPARITQSAIGNVTLGLTASAYASLLHEEPFVTSYPNGTSRLSFSAAEILVFLDRTGRGVRITTAASEYTLGRGVGPCGALRTLAHARRLTPVAITGPFGTSAVVYRTGRLWFTVAASTHIGTVTLSATKPDLKALIGEAQCGVGDEEGE
jgi:hypothetical protein